MNKSTEIIGELGRKKEWSYGDILKAKTPEQVTEASLEGASQHISSEEMSFAILAATNPPGTPLTYEENNRRTGQLERAVWARNLGFCEVKGVGPTDDKGTRSVDRSLVIFKTTLRVALRLAAIVPPPQYSIIYKGPETGHVMKLILVSDGSVMKDLGAFHPMKMGDYFTMVKGHPFTLEPELIESGHRIVFELMPSEYNSMRSRSRVKLPGIDD